MLHHEARSQVEATPGEERVCLIVQWVGHGPAAPDPSLDRNARMRAHQEAVAAAKAPLLAALAERGVVPSAPLQGMMCAVLVGTADAWRACLPLLEGEGTLVQPNAVVEVEAA